MEVLSSITFESYVEDKAHVQLFFASIACEYVTHAFKLIGMRMGDLHIKAFLLLINVHEFGTPFVKKNKNV